MGGPERTSGWWLGLPLVLAALLWVGFNTWLGLDPDDAENLETTRVLAAARSWTEGPQTLYGPYSASNPAVLIQAPLFYRLTSVVAFPWILMNFDAFSSCLVAGRLISFVSFGVVLMLTYHLARIAGAPWAAGAWAACLVAGSPLLGSFSVAMRPDMLAIAWQTGGLLLVARVLFGPSRWDRHRLVEAFLLFGLAFVTKQHLIIGPIVAALGLLGRRRDLLRPAPIVVALGLTTFLVLVYLGCEQAITHGAMGRSVFVLPGELKHVTTGSWSYVGVVFLETAKRGLGLLVLALALFVASREAAMLTAYERWLLLAIGLELALMVQLCRNSSGGWFNYALPALVAGSVVLGRRLAGSFAATPSRRLGLVFGAALLLVAVDVRLVVKGAQQRRAVHLEQAELTADTRVSAVPCDERYFAGTYQHYNRLFGCVGLTHDEWLYKAFEAINAAEPRERWLRRALTDGPIRLVLVERERGPRVAGVSESLPDLGYEDAGDLGPFTLWRRREAARD